MGNFLGSYGATNGASSSKFGGSYTPGDNAAAQSAGMVSDQNNHLINSFKTLDPTTRVNVLFHLAHTGQFDKVQLLKDHAGDNYVPMPTYKNSLATNAELALNSATGAVKSHRQDITNLSKDAAVSVLGGPVGLAHTAVDTLTHPQNHRLTAGAVGLAGNLLLPNGTAGDKAPRNPQGQLVDKNGNVYNPKTLPNVPLGKKGAQLLPASAGGHQVSNMEAAQKAVSDRFLVAGGGVQAGAAAANIAGNAAAGLTKSGEINTPVAKFQSYGKQVKEGGLIPTVVGAGVDTLLAGGGAASEIKALKASAQGAANIKTAAQLSNLDKAIKNGDAAYAKSGTGLPGRAPQLALPEGRGASTLKNVDGSPITNGSLTATTRAQRINQIDQQLQDFQNAKGSLTPNDAKALMTERHQLSTQNALDVIAQDHARATGQPIQAAHDTLGAGIGERAPVYQAVRDAAPVAHDINPKVTNAEHIGALAASAPDRAAQAQKQGGLLRSAYNQARGFFGAVSASPLSKEAAQIISQALAEGKNGASLLKAEQTNAKAEKFFNGLGDAQNIANTSHYERNGKFAAEPHANYSSDYQKSMDASHAVLAHVYGEDKVGYIDNYVRRNLQFANDGQATAATNLLFKEYGSTSVTKGRALNIPLDQALAKLKAAGIDAKPITTNPETLRQWTMINAHKALAYQNAYETQVKNGLISTTQHPGMVAVKREVIQGLAPSMAGVNHYAYPEVNTILQNATSKGLSNQPLYKLAQKTSAGLGQITLALPAYHATMTAGNALATEVANSILQGQKSISQLSHGEFGAALKSGIGAAKSAGLSATVVGPGIKDFAKGSALMKEIKAGKYGEEAINVLNAAGGRLAVPSEYHTGATQVVKNAFAQPSVVHTLKAIGAAPFAIAETVAKPLMEGVIPRVKLGALMDRASQIMADGKTLDSPGVKQALQDASRSIDNRMGEVVMDNKFWNPVIRDLAKTAYLSIGYRGGTIGELAGGGKDVLSAAGQNAKGLLTKGKFAAPALSERAAFAIAVPLAAAYTGTLYQVAHTGKMPTDLHGAIFPDSGTKDANGNVQRVQLPNYIKDFKNIYGGPGGWGKEIGPTSPALKTAWEIISNRDYKGDMIRNPSDSLVKQGQQVGKNLGSRFVPIAAQNQLKQSGTNPGLLRRGEALFGINNAPAAESQSKLQKEIYQLKGASAPKTPEQQAQASLKTQFFKDVKAGKAPAQSAAYQQLIKTMSPGAIKSLISTSNEDGLQYSFDHLQTPQKIKTILDNSSQDLKQIKYDTFAKTLINELKTGKFDTTKGYTVQQAKDALTKAGYGSNTYSKVLQDTSAQRKADYRAGKLRGKTPSQL